MQSTHRQAGYYCPGSGAGLPSASANALKIRSAGTTQGMPCGPSFILGMPSGQSPEEMSLLASTATTASSSG